MMRSVLGQTYAGLELVLADASDAAHGEVEKAVRAVRDARVRYIRLAKNGGIAENTNAALAAAQGEYIALLDHDDVLTPNALYEAVKAVNEQGADFVYSDEIVLDSTLKKLGEYISSRTFPPTRCAAAITSRIWPYSAARCWRRRAAANARNLTARRIST
jgi:glycosyltransferase involved in cell wall biosynthesis